jgi:tetratricopeptide (TPR) repeat protein
MCVHPNTPEYDRCLRDVAELTRVIGSGKATAQDYLNRAEWLQLMSEIPGAVRDYTRALARREELTLDDLAFLYVRRGVCYRRLARYPQALEDIQQAIALKPETEYYWSCLGMVRYHQHDYRQGVADLTYALELDPVNDERSWEFRGLCYQSLGEHEAAIADFSHRLGMAVEPFAKLYAYRAYSYVMLGRNAEALADCQRGSALDPHGGPFELYRLMGHAYFALGDAAGALGAFSQALALAPEVAELHLWRGQAFHALGDEAAAADDFTEFVRRHPDGAAQALFDLSQMFGSVAAPALNAPAAVAA